MSGWRPALRIAWRDALRHRGRSMLVLVMISLPVLAVSAAAVIIKTSQVEGIEKADRYLGASAARLVNDGRGEVIQAPDPSNGDYVALRDLDYDNPPDEAELVAALGGDVRLVPITTGWERTRLGDRVIDFTTTGVDLHDPAAAGLFELRSGRLPDAPGEVVVNDAMLDKGFAVGDDLEVGARTLTIVGVGRDATWRDEAVVVGSYDDLSSQFSEGHREWLVDSAPISWEQVRQVNRLGGVVTSRAVLADPPDFSALAEQLGYDDDSSEVLAVVALIIVMALIEVVLLAGPAFAVGARRQARTLALVAASGGTPAQSRRIILASGVVLGVVASIVGLVAGILAGWALLPLVQRLDGQWFGPLELPWPYLAAIVAFGVVSALLASLVPAWLASRQDVVAVLAGRRGDRRPRASTPVVGLVMLGIGIAASTYGALSSDSDNGAFLIAGSAIVSVLGMILVVPVVVSALARLSGRLPLTARYAARDAARHRTRTVPAVAAVAATVAGVVALGIASTSDELANEQTYTPQTAMGTALVSWSPDVLPGEPVPDAADVWPRIEDAVATAAPDVEVGVLRGPDDYGDGRGYTSTMLRLPKALEARTWELQLSGPSVTVADDADHLFLDPDVQAAADAALADGRAVVFVADARQGEQVAEVALRTELWQDGVDRPEVTKSEPFEAEVLALTGDGYAPTGAIVPTSVAARAGLDVVVSELVLTGDIDRATETRIEEQVAGAAAGTYLYVERGYQRPPEATIVLLVLGALGGVLMLGGTLTATFLALSDARPDLATLSAVGAAPRTRRRVAAAYALVIGVVGAVLGAVVGFIPGVAISRPLTSFGDDGPYLDVPWLLVVTIVLALPLLTAAVVGLTARSRLPLVARLD